MAHDQAGECVDELRALSIEGFLGYQVRRASVVIMNDFIETFAELPVRPVSFSVASVIDDRPGVSSAEICRILGLQRANIVSVLEKLQSEGFVRRTEAPSDMRVQRLYLTEAGVDALRSWKARAMEHENRIFARLDRDERKQLDSLLRKIWS